MHLGWAAAAAQVSQRPPTRLIVWRHNVEVPGRPTLQDAGDVTSIICVMLMEK